MGSFKWAILDIAWSLKFIDIFFCSGEGFSWRPQDSSHGDLWYCWKQKSRDRVRRRECSPFWIAKWVELVVPDQRRCWSYPEKICSFYDVQNCFQDLSDEEEAWAKLNLLISAEPYSFKNQSSPWLVVRQELVFKTTEYITSQVAAVLKIVVRTKQCTLTRFVLRKRHKKQNSQIDL